MNNKLLSILVAAALAAHPEVNAQSRFSLEQIVNDDGETIDDWIEGSQPLTIKLIQTNKQKSSLLKQGSALEITEQFQVLLGDSDITSLFEYKNQHLKFAGGIPLPAGENQLTISQLIDGEWQEIGNTPLSVMTTDGFKQAEWTPTLELNVNSQLDERVTGDATRSERPSFTDVTASIGLSSHHEKDNFSIDSNINLFAVSNREQAIQYGNKLNQASKWDVADYSVSMINGNHFVQVGHTSYGNNSLLIDNLSRRGISWQYQNENELTFNGAILSGTDIVGYNNFLGLADHSKQFVNTLGFGFNTFTQSRISLRLEGTYLDAERLSQDDFGVAGISNAEQNQGMAFKLIASDSENKLNADLSIGLSRYTNPDDLSLSFGDDLVALETETAVAHNLNVSYALIEEWQTPWGSDTYIILNGNHSSAEPLYQTLTAYVQANVENKMVGAQYQVGSVSGGFSTQSSRDNLDNLVNLLTTKTKNDSFSASMPLAQIFGEDNEESQPSQWLPGLDYGFQETHQFALNSPDAIDSGFNGGSHLPDQLTTSHNLSSNWQFDSYSISLQSNHTEQDNRQAGRDEADFSSLQHAIGINIQQNDTTSWAFSLAKNRLLDQLANKIEYSKSATVSYSWQSLDGLGLSVNYAISKDDDSLDEAKNTSTNADVGIVKNLIKGEWWIPVDGSISLRLNYNDNKAIDNVFNQASRFGTKTAQLGINLNF